MSPAAVNDYLRAACGLDLLDGPPGTLTYAQAAAALQALAADADAEVLRVHRYHELLAAAIRNAKATPVSLPS